MLKQKYFLTGIFILSAERQPIKLAWRKIVWLPYKRPFYEGQVLYQYMADGRWTPETAATAVYPRLSISSSTNQETSSVWLKDASYIKLKNLTIGYNITQQKILKAIGASKLTVQFTGYNLLTFDKLKVFDPEGELTRDTNTYPIMKIFSLGVNVTF